MALVLAMALRLSGRGGGGVPVVPDTSKNLVDQLLNQIVTQTGDALVTQGT